MTLVRDIVAAKPQTGIGSARSRIDGALKVQGQAQFAAEFPMDRLSHAVLVHGTVAKGSIATLETGAAEAAPGVVLVMTYRNAPRMNAPPAFGASEKGAAGSDLPIMQDATMSWNGEPIAVVVAESLEQAQYAATLVRATYNVEPATTQFAAAKVHAEVASFGGEPLSFQHGDAEIALAAAPAKVDVTYRTPRHNHNALELHGATLAWNDGHLIVHDASQAVSHAAWTLAHVFGIDAEHIHVTSPFVGGGFGSKTVWGHHILAAAAAKLVDRPVRLVLSREGVYRDVGGRAATEQRVAIGAQPDGRFDALIHTGVTAKTPHNYFAEPFISATQHLYDAGTMKLEVRATALDTIANTFMRAPGEAVGTVALECAIDELADQLGLDPIAVRLRNEPDRDPTSGHSFSTRNLARAYAAGAERFAWDKRQSTPATQRDGEWMIGMGCATGTYPYNRMPDAAARIRLTRDGRAVIEAPGHEMGMGTATTQTMIGAELLGLPFDDVRFSYADSAFPGFIIAGGSQQTAAISAALIAARRALMSELAALITPGSPLSGLSVEELVCRNGGLSAVDDPDRHETYASLLECAGRDELTVDTPAPAPDESDQWSMHSYSAIFAEVRVSAVTGEIRVSRLLGSFDCGRIVNPKTARSQFRGGMIMGLGLALMEETQLDERSGRTINRNLSDYHIPVQLDVPPIDVIWTDIPDPRAPLGIHGVGEIGITGVGAAIANAVYNATGKRLRDFPLTLDKLIDAPDAAPS